MATTFTLLLLVFAAILIVGGLYTKKWISSNDDYVLAGREISFALNMFGVGAIAFAGTTIVFSSGLAVMYGFWGSLAWGIVLAIGGKQIYGFLFAPVIRTCGAQTLPEWLEIRYSSRVRLLVTISTIVGLCGIMANNIASMALVVAEFIGWPLPLVISVMFLLFLVFSYTGGFWAISLTDFIQMCMGLVLLPTVLIYLISTYGGFDTIIPIINSTGSDFWFRGVGGQTLPILSLKYPSLLTFAIAFMAFLVWGNNYYWLRISTTRNVRVASFSYVAAAYFCMISFTILALIGLYGLAANPTLFAPAGKVSPMGVYGVLLRGLPPLIASFALLAALAASISTATTAHIGVVSTIVRDIYNRVIKKDASGADLLKVSKYVLLLSGLAVWALCFYPGGPLYLFAFSGAWLGPPAVLVVLGFWWTKFHSRAAFYSSIITILVLSIITVLELTKVFVLANYMHLSVPGLIITVGLAILFTYTMPKEQAKDKWSGKIGLQESKILFMLQNGYEIMADLTDMLGVDSRITSVIINGLVNDGYIKRQGDKGAAFYRFTITEKGINTMPILSDTDRKLMTDQLNGAELYILHMCAENRMAELSDKFNLSGLQISVFVNKLIRSGYLSESGMFRRKIAVTTNGNEILLKYRELNKNNLLKCLKSVAEKVTTGGNTYENYRFECSV